VRTPVFLENPKKNQNPQEGNKRKFKKFNT